MIFEKLAGEYTTLWHSADIKTDMLPAARKMAAKMSSNRARYMAVSEATGVPWYVVGLIHTMEAGQNFGCHLHNGDPLAKPTVNVPANRPRKSGGPFTWEESAIDAIRFDKLDKVANWTLERVCYELEKFNGWGYRNHHPEVLSPYLWSGTNHYAAGKYVADGKWSATAVSQQVGAVAVLRCLMEIDTAIALGDDKPEPEPTPESFRKAFVDAPKPLSKSGTIWGAILAFASAVLSYVDQAIGWAVSFGTDALSVVTGELSALRTIAEQAGANGKSIALGLGVTGSIIVFSRRAKAKLEGKIG